ncbi:hypothetical protein V1477_004243 [Vespula maculifrons]
MKSRDTRLRETTTKSGLGPTFTVTSSVTYMRSGDSRLRMTTTISVLWPTFIVPGSVTYMRSGDSRLRMTTTISVLWPTFIVPGSVVLWTSTNLNVKWGYTASRDDNNIGSLADLYSSWFSSALDIDEVGILGFERRQQSRVLDRPLQLLVQLCFGLRRENLEIFADGIRANLNVKWGYTASRDDNNIGSLADLYSSWFSSALDIDE